MNDKPQEVTPEEQAKLDEQLDTEYSLKFKKREWIVIYNVLVSQAYKLGDARIVNPICDKIQAVAAFEHSTGNGVVTK